MDSADHRHNLLGAGFEHFGFGLAADGAGRLYAVQMFAGPGTPRRAEGTPAPQVVAADAQLAMIAEVVNRVRVERDLPPLAPSEVLSIAAGTLIAREPGEALAGVVDIPAGEILETMPIEERGRWQALSLLIGECGGCGRDPTDADLRLFAERWLGTERPGGLVDPAATHLGFALRSDGNGRKTALAVIGIGR